MMMTNLNDYKKLPSEEEEEEVETASFVVVDYGTDEKDDDDINKLPKASIVVHETIDHGQQRRRRRRCFGPSCLCGCLCTCALITLVILVLLTIVTIGFVAFTYWWMKDVVVHFTVTETKDLPTFAPMTDIEANVFQDRINLFVDELRSHRSNNIKDDLIITQDEINGMLSRSDYLRGHIVVTLTPGTIREEFSLPTDLLPGGMGRYFAGTELVEVNKDDEDDREEQFLEAHLETTATHEDWFTGPLFFLRLQYLVNADPRYQERLLELYLQSGTSFFGQDVPPEVIDEHKNLLEDLYNDPNSGSDVRAIINGIDTVSIEKGRIVIKPARRQGVEDGPHPPAEGQEQKAYPAVGSSSSSDSSSSSSDSSSSEDVLEDEKDLSLIITKSSIRRGTTNP